MCSLNATELLVLQFNSVWFSYCQYELKRLSVLTFSPLIRFVKTAQLKCNRERESHSEVTDSRGWLFLDMFFENFKIPRQCALYSVCLMWQNLRVIVLKITSVV